MDSNNVRNSSIELYRIIVMLLIVAHHYVVNSGLMEKMQDFSLSPQSIFFYLFGAWGKTGINCFVLITGYFMCKSSITVQKFLKLLLEVLFYNILIYLLFVMSGYEAFSHNGLLQLIPARYVADGFVSCFLLFYLCIPFYYCPIKILKSHKIRADFICDVSPFSLDFSRQTIKSNYGQKYTF